MGTANATPPSVLSRLGQTGRFLQGTLKPERADLDSGLSFPKSFLGGPTKLLMALQG